MQLTFARLCFSAALIITLALTPTKASAKVTLPNLFSDGAVLQRDQKVPVWGFAQPGEKVTVSIGQQKHSAVTNARGRWRVTLDNMPAGGPHDLKVAGENVVTVKNVVFGEVWLCAGQSNMLFPLWKSEGGLEEIKAANYPDLRMFSVKKQFARRPVKSAQGKWTPTDPEHSSQFSAVAYFFGKELKHDLKVPVGLIECSVGGAPIDTFMSRASLERVRDYAQVIQQWDEATAKEAPIQGYHTALFDFKTVPNEDNPNSTLIVPGVGAPSIVFNGMIAPLVPYAIKGVVWYQGEANVKSWQTYRSMFIRLIEDWRERWNQDIEAFPFLFVQLPNFSHERGTDWAYLREAQKGALDIRNTHMAVSIDIGDAEYMHPKNKREVGRRLALLALSNCYGRKCDASGPMFESVKSEGSKVHLHFKNIGNGLKARGPELKGFEIAGMNGKFREAKAAIKGSDVVVWSDEIRQPASVRYAWADNPVCNLYNSADLPAVPFKADVYISSERF